MKDYLNRLISEKETEMTNLRDKMKASEDVNEVRSIGDTLEKLAKEIGEAREQLAKLDEKDERSAFNPNATIATVKMNEKRDDANELGSMEYREAFMKYVQRGEKSDLLKFEQRADASGVASDLGVLLPTTVVQEIIKGVEKVYGQLYSRVKKTNIKGGVKYPIGSFTATFSRITESTKSDRLNAGGVTGYVEFSYNIGEIRIAQSLLQNVLSVPVFEAELSKVILEAYVEAMDKEIMLGDATNNQCEGILTEANKVTSRIPASNIISFNATEIADWTEWQKKLFAVIPLSMRGLNPQFVMTANTYEANIKTLKDLNSRPVYTETFNPVDGAEIARFKGRDVVFVEDDVLGNFNDISVASGSTDSPYFGMYWVPDKAYAINTNMEFTVMRYFDQETNQYVDKALVINDGKVLDPKYIYLLKKVAPQA